MNCPYDTDSKPHERLIEELACINCNPWTGLKLLRIDKNVLIARLDELDTEDFFGTEGWRKFLGFKD